MKKNLIFSAVALLLVYSCGRGEYSTIRNNNNALQTTTTTTTSTDPADSFTDTWSVQSVGSIDLVDSEKRTLANFLGFNTSHDAYLLDWPIPCYYGYTAGFGSAQYTITNPLRNYFQPRSSLIAAYPAPKDLGEVLSYKVRFSANVDQNTSLIIPGSAFLEVTVDASASSKVMVRRYTKMKADLKLIVNTTASGLYQSFRATWTDDNGCGDVTFAGYEHEGTLYNGTITYNKTMASYKNSKCYADGVLPKSSFIPVGDNNDLSNASGYGYPDGTDVNSYYGGNWIFPNEDDIRTLTHE